MKFYMAFQSREFGYNLFSAAILMAPNPMPYAVYVIAVGVYFVAFCINNIIKADVYGFRAGDALLPDHVVVPHRRDLHVLALGDDGDGVMNADRCARCHGQEERRACGPES